LSDKHQQVHVNGQIETSIRPDLIKKYDADQTKQDSREKIKLRVEIATLIVVFVYTTVAFGQGCSGQKSANAAKNSAAAARESLEATQRAFVGFSVHLTPIAIVPEKKLDHIPVAWMFDVPIVNSGTTPTHNMLAHVYAASLKDGMTKDFDFRDSKDGWRIFIGPKDSPVSETNAIPITDISGVWKGTMHVYIYGWATYNDILPETPLHVAKFCYELSVRGNPQSTAVPYTWYKFVPFHNCEDEECNTNQ
jgi:hypothetical protein